MLLRRRPSCSHVSSDTCQRSELADAVSAFDAQQHRARTSHFNFISSSKVLSGLLHTGDNGVGSTAALDNTVQHPVVLPERLQATEAAAVRSATADRLHEQSRVPRPSVMRRAASLTRRASYSYVSSVACH